jgi:hypothetical protein
MIFIYLIAFYTHKLSSNTVIQTIITQYNIFYKRKSLWPIWTLYLNSNDCLIKVQISDERFGLRIYFNLFKSDILTVRAVISNNIK